MGITIKDRALTSFSNKLGLQDFSDLKNKVATAFADRGVEIAKNLYGSEKIQVSSSNSQDGRTSIIAKGDSVAYLEFGTGIQGMGKYPDPTKLPKETLVFYSRKAMQKTDGWQYNYFKKQMVEKGVKDADKIKDYIGQAPQAQMFHTAQQLKNEKSKIIKKVLRSGK